MEIKEWYELMILNLPLLLAFGLDLLLGDPLWLPHPVVGFGKLIAWGEKKLNKGTRKLMKGAGFTLLLVLGIYFFSNHLLSLLAQGSAWAAIVLEAALIFCCLAGTTLRREVRAVFQALEHSLEEGREQVGRIVGRDTGQLSPQEVRTAALETLAENLSDGVIAPLFWYFLLGVPGMLAYKMINTLDSMIGYRNERYKQFGCFAARMDDVANYIPARLTALLMLLCSGKLHLLKFVWRYGREHLSPNSGYPEAALAGILNCRFGGPHNYFNQEVWKPYIGHNDRQITVKDLVPSLRINISVEWLTIVIIVVLKSYWEIIV